MNNPRERHAELVEASLLRNALFTLAVKMLRQAQHDVLTCRSSMYVYILTNTGRTVLYIGVTNDLTRRLHEHRASNGDASKFTGRYQADLLVYFELLPNATQAISREKQLNGPERRRMR